MKTKKGIKFLVVLVVLLGLVNSAMAAGPDDLLIYYTMDAEDPRYGYQYNYGRLGSIGDGKETFLAADNGYAPGMFCDAVILSNDGPPGFDPNSWYPPDWEMGNIIDIQAEAESFEPDMRPFENKTISLWFKQTAPIDPELHLPGSDCTEYLLGSYFTYTTYIALRPNEDSNLPDVLGFRAGARGTVLGKDGSELGGNTRSDWYYADIEMNVWNHAAMVLKNTAGDPTHDMEASFYLNGVLVGSEAGLTKDSDSFYWGAPQPWNRVAIGGYQNDATTAFHTTNHPTGALVDDFAILGIAAGSDAINAIYEMGLVGIPISGVAVVCPPTVYHVDGATGNNANDGLSPETAFASIQKGIDTARDGNTVLVWPGVYNETATHGINFGNKAVTVKSAADAAVLEVPGFPAVTFTNGADANSVFSNFVVRGSDTGIFVLYANPTISNVTVVDNDNGVIADTANPLITNSIFYNNTNGDLFGSPDPITAQYSWVEDEQQADPNLIAYWKLDGDAVDSAGSNDGTIYGATPTTGQINDALDFDGDGDYVEIPDNSLLTPEDKITISFWLYNRGGQTAGIYKYASCPGELSSPGNSRAYYIQVSDATGEVGFRIFSSVSTYDDIVSNNVTTLNDWHHIAATFDQGQAAIYIDGQLDNSTTMSVSSIMDDAQPLIIGGHWEYCGTDNFVSRLNGTIDDVRIYNRALSTEEIEAMYEAGLVGREYLGLGPLFADANAGDYHLLCERGRYRATTDEWLLDEATSPCIDGGDPNVEPENERMPNGGRINMGAYGGTESASMSEWPLAGDLNLDGIVNFKDFAAFAQLWQETLPWIE